MGRTELLSSEADDWSGCVSNTAGWLAGVATELRGSKSLLLLDSAAETLQSVTHTQGFQGDSRIRDPKAAATAPSKSSRFESGAWPAPSLTNLA